MRLRWFAMLWLLAWPALADDRTEILALGRPNGRVLMLQISRPWALVAYMPPTGDPACTYLLRRTKAGHWKVAMGGGGAMGASEIFRYGVPQSQWPLLLKYKPSPAEVKAALAVQPMWPQDSREPLIGNELSGLSAWELRLRGHELLARHGVVFAYPDLRNYFSQRPWYKPDPRATEARLTELERGNLQIIQRLQKEAGDY